MFNLRFILNPGSCGWFCLKYILKIKVKKQVYMNVYDIKKTLNDNGYYCSCLKVYNINDINFECLTLIRIGKSNNHFVIVKKLNEKYIYFYDPLYMLIRRWRRERFVKRWINICLIYTKV